MPNKNEDISENLKDMFQKIIGTVDYTGKYKAEDIAENKTMAVLSYIIPLIPFIKEKDNAYIKFHSNQGMNLWVWFIFISLFIWMLHTGFPKWKVATDFLMIVLTIALVASIVYGIRNVVNDKAKELPLVSRLNLVTIVCNFFGI